MHVPEFFVLQRFHLMVNRYEVVAANADGSTGELLAFAEQKRMAFREQVTFFRDTAKTSPIFSFKARAVIDLGAGYDVTDEHGTSLGFFKKDFGRSLLRSTFRIEGPGFSGVGQERNQVVALLRRFTDVSFLPVHFDFHDPDGNLLFASSRQMALRDRYTVTVPSAAIDFRFAAALAVALDALMAR
jgi:hypothetical protein